MGIGSYKYGGAKDGVLNIEAVLPDGTVINTGYKNIGDYVSGYNLNQLFAGSEEHMIMIRLKDIMICFQKKIVLMQWRIVR